LELVFLLGSMQVDLLGILYRTLRRHLLAWLMCSCHQGRLDTQSASKRTRCSVAKAEWPRVALGAQELGADLPGAPSR